MPTLALAACGRGPTRNPGGKAPGRGPGDAPPAAAVVAPVPGPALDPSIELYRLAFGSCLDQDKPQPIFEPISAYDPQVFVMLGDNVYADAEDEARLVEAYGQLGASEGYRALRATTPVLATWDDHDYGRNDSGAEYPLKEVSQRVMLDFFGEPRDSPRRTRQGVYEAYVIGPPGRRVQIILLDTRYHRTEIFPIAPGAYRPQEDPEATILGAAQWAWLEAQLRMPAEVRIVVSSIQVVSDDHPNERWGVFPRERERLFSLVGETGAAGVLFVSGDRHRGELSRLAGSAAGYPLYDLTSSSLNRPAPRNEANSARIGELIVEPNFGTVDFVWEGQAHVELRLTDSSGAIRLRRAVTLDELQV